MRNPAIEMLPRDDWEVKPPPCHPERLASLARLGQSPNARTGRVMRGINTCGADRRESDSLAPPFPPPHRLLAVAVPAAQPPISVYRRLSADGLAVICFARRVSRATLAHPDSAPQPTHNAPRAIFAPARNSFRTPTRGRASRHPPRHAPLSPLPAHPGVRAPRPRNRAPITNSLGDPEPACYLYE
jgi:hypothetical protein